MNKTTKRKLAKERSFVGKLTNAQIENLLNKCGYALNKNVYTDDGEKLPAIERGYDGEKDEYSIFIRCTKQDKVATIVHNTLTSALNLPFSQFNLSDCIVMLKDFEFIELSIQTDEHSNSQQVYAKYMYNLFGEYYRKEYNKNIRKNIREQEKEKSN